MHNTYAFINAFTKLTTQIFLSAFILHFIPENCLKLLILYFGFEKKFYVVDYYRF